MADVRPGTPELGRSAALRLSRVLLAGGIAWLAACGARPGGSPAPLSDPCVFQTGYDGAVLDTVRVVLAEPPLAGGDSTMGDRFIARLLGPQVEEADCRGFLRRPLGTQPRYAIVTPPGSEGTRLLRSSGGGGPAVIQVNRAAPDADLRDLLDRGTDLLFAHDRRTADYAGAHPDLVLLPTGSHRAYFLVTTDGHRVDDPSSADRADLADRAVRGAAVPLMSSPAVDSGCPRPRADAVGSRRPVVVYPAEDEVARQLAERVASLAVGSSRPRWVIELGPDARAEAVGTVDEVMRIVARGEAAAAVVPAHSGATVGCLVPLGARVTPLVATTHAVVARRGVPPLRWVPGQLIGFEAVDR